MSYNTLHIFGFGECQVITDTENKKVPTEDCPSAQAVIDMVYSHKPSDNPTTEDYRNVNIFNDLFADFSDNQGNTFRVEYSELEVSLIDDLIEEVLNF